jgi:hypothetical protein
MFIEASDDRSGDMKLHPSGISGCERNAIYSSRGEPVSNPRPVRNTRIMGNGTLYHEKLQAYITEKYPDAIIEQEVEWGPIKGAADILLPAGIMRDTDGDKTFYELADFKTTSPNGMRYLVDKPKGRTAARKGEPKPGHVKQCRIYYMGLRRMGFNLLPEFRIVYINRDDWETVEFLLEPWTLEEEEDYLEQMAELEAHLMDGTLPEPLTDDYWLCKMCEFRSTCKPDQYPTEEA